MKMAKELKVKNKEVTEKQSEFKSFISVTKMQLKNKVDVSWTKSAKSIIRVVILTLLKSLIVGAIAFGMLYILNVLGIYRAWNAYQIVIVILSLSLILSLISCTFGLTKNLYFSDDNKVLITFPVSANKIFISKIIVYYIYELKRSLTFLIPITIACFIMLLINSKISIFVFLWMWIPLIFIIALPVLLGALLSIPVMGIKILFNKVPPLRVVFFSLLATGSVALVVYIILSIPYHIDFANQILIISDGLNNILRTLERYLIIERELVYLMIGDLNVSQMYGISIWVPIRFIILVVSMIILALTSYYISRPLFLKMVSKTIEKDAGITKSTKNVKHGKIFTFFNKEFKINVRNINVLGTLLVTYIVIPIIILLLNKIFGAMDLSNLGSVMACAFNILLICLPLLATNALVASMYSKEGRAGYIKKTKPVKPYYPLIAKMALSIILSIPSIIVSVSIFSAMGGIGIKFYDAIILMIAIFALHLGHMFYSATLDITNPQNERYATSGESQANPNEDKSTIVAFALAIIFALFTFILVNESLIRSIYTIACIKLLFIGGLILLAGVLLFFKNIKAYYGK